MLQTSGSFAQCFSVFLSVAASNHVDYSVSSSVGYRSCYLSPFSGSEIAKLALQMKKAYKINNCFSTFWFGLILTSWCSDTEPDAFFLRLKDWKSLLGIWSIWLFLGMSEGYSNCTRSQKPWVSVISSSENHSIWWLTTFPNLDRCPWKEEEGCVWNHGLTIIVSSLCLSLLRYLRYMY